MYYGFMTALYKNSVVVVNSIHPSVVTGDVITHVNGEPVLNVLQRMKEYLA
jgi:hypothetical protein